MVYPVVPAGMMLAAENRGRRLDIFPGILCMLDSAAAWSTALPARPMVLPLPKLYGSRSN